MSRALMVALAVLTFPEEGLLVALQGEARESPGRLAPCFSAAAAAAAVAATLAARAALVPLVERAAAAVLAAVER